jgi:uncharacterized protein
MGRRERYEPGTFCWVDLATTDPAGAKDSYGALFGWKAEDRSPSPGQTRTCTMLSLDGDEVCGLYELDAGRCEQGVPPHWFYYVNVEDADATARKAHELGGTVHGEAFDVLEAGRTAIIEDLTGAVLAAWQPLAHAGAIQVNNPGCLTWNELQSGDPETASAFYADLFGWETEPVKEDGNLVYVVLQNAGSSNGGTMPMTVQHGDVPLY